MDFKKFLDGKVWLWFAPFAAAIVFVSGFAAKYVSFLAGQYVGPIVVAPLIAVLWAKVVRPPVL